MKKALRVFSVLGVFFIFGILGSVLVKAPFAYAAWCKNNFCIPSFDFKSGNLKNSTYQIENANPNSPKKWVPENIGDRPGYCNGGICVSELKLPKLVMANRRNVNDGTSVYIDLGLYGETGEWWYTRQNEYKDNTIEAAHLKDESNLYPNDGIPDTIKALTDEQWAESQGYTTKPGDGYLCPDDDPNSWDDKFDVKTAGIQGAIASKDDPDICYDSAIVLVRKGQNEDVTGKWGGQRTMYRQGDRADGKEMWLSNENFHWVNHAWDGYAVDPPNGNDDCVTGGSKGVFDLDHPLEICDDNGWGRNTRRKFPDGTSDGAPGRDARGCDWSPYDYNSGVYQNNQGGEQKWGCGYYIAGPAGNRYWYRSMADKYEVDSTRKKWNENKPVYATRYRKVEKVPAFRTTGTVQAGGIQALEDKNAYKDYDANDPNLKQVKRVDNIFRILYDHDIVARKIQEAIPSYDHFPVTNSDNFCLLGKHTSFIGIHKKKDFEGKPYVEYTTQVLGEITDAYNLFRYLSVDKQNSVREKYQLVTKNDINVIKSWDDATTNTALRALGQIVVQNKQLESLLVPDVLERNEYCVLVGMCVNEGLRIQANASASNMDDGQACQVILPSTIGINSTYEYFTGKADIPAVGITSFRAIGYDDLTKKEESKEGGLIDVFMEKNGNAALYRPVITLTSSPKDSETLVIHTRDAKIDVRLAWDTMYAEKTVIRIPKNGVSFVAGETSEVSDVKSASGDITIKDLAVGKTYSFALDARNQNGNGEKNQTGQTDTSWIKVKKVNVRVVAIPMTIDEPTYTVKFPRSLNKIFVGWSVKDSDGPIQVRVKMDSSMYYCPNQIIAGLQSKPCYEEDFGTQAPTGTHILDHKVDLYGTNVTVIATDSKGRTVSAEKHVKETEIPFIDLIREGMQYGKGILDGSLLSLFGDFCDEPGQVMSFVCGGTSVSNILGYLSWIIAYLKPAVNAILAFGPIIMDTMGIIMNAFVHTQILHTTVTEFTGENALKMILSSIPTLIANLAGGALGELLLGKCGGGLVANFLSDITKRIMGGTAMLFDALGNGKIPDSALGFAAAPMNGAIHVIKENPVACVVTDLLPGNACQNLMLMGTIGSAVKEVICIDGKDLDGGECPAAVTVGENIGADVGKALAPILTNQMVSGLCAGIPLCSDVVGKVHTVVETVGKAVPFLGLDKCFEKAAEPECPKGQKKALDPTGKIKICVPDICAPENKELYTAIQRAAAGCPDLIIPVDWYSCNPDTHSCYINNEKKEYPTLPLCTVACIPPPPHPTPLGDLIVGAGCKFVDPVGAGGVRKGTKAETTDLFSQCNSLITMIGECGARWIGTTEKNNKNQVTSKGGQVPAAAAEGAMRNNRQAGVHTNEAIYNAEGENGPTAGAKAALMEMCNMAGKTTKEIEQGIACFDHRYAPTSDDDKNTPGLSMCPDVYKEPHTP